MVIYGDLIFLLSLLMDFLILQLTSLILKKRSSITRSFLGALVGSIVVLLAFTPYSYVFASPFMKILLSFVIVFVAFGRQRMAVFLQLLSAFYFSTFILGGAIFALHYLFSTQDLFSTKEFFKTKNFFGDPISWIFELFLIPPVVYYSRKSTQSIAFTNWKLNELYDIEIKWRKVVICVKGLMDSGNSLVEPLTRKPVIILDVSEQDYNLPSELVNLVRQNQFNMQDEDVINKLSFFQATFVPYKSIGQSNQFIVAVKPASVRIKIKGKWYQSSSVLIGLSHVTLSSDGIFNCILHPKMMEGKIVDTA
ncbi:sigma-E processing peptidase SpoIIGA [Bacillus sp. RG28]|uniref:Sporulation sigma-E factor-processing peptidase n=1 Tax=Gottfriedia endophytica TaxID=2820819 RepID=A0A940SIB8_9BACI|nr:sigma-E processing peptidase SpoIIGA [Gottfriedia endophytica]MBP0724820.1 sigma-E processing peptidase SpoIIGA [Gottfriedia endophytica]